MNTISEAFSEAQSRHARGELAQAENIYRQILAADPRHGDTLHSLGVLVLGTGRAAEAVQMIEQAAAIDPANVRYRGNLGAAYWGARRFEDARVALEQAIRDDPTYVEAYYNLGVTFSDLGRIAEAESAYQRCLQLVPAHSTALNNLGNMLREQGRLDEAAAYLEQAVAADPGFVNAHYNRAVVWLTQGRFAEGWAEYEWRWRCAEFPRRYPDRPQWDGRPLPGATLLLHAEQGLGDTLQFVRYLPLVRQRAPRVLLEVQSGLIPLLHTSGIGPLVAQGAVAPPFDVCLSMASLPGVLGTTLETIPAPVPYLRAQGELAAAWRSHLGRYQAFKIGIAWQGNPKYREDRYRSIPLAEFAPLAAVSGVRLFSLQKGPGSEQLPPLKGPLGIVDLGSNLDVTTGPFMDTTAIMQSLDLVITSDTATAHLAGALGVPVWVALRQGPDWRWLAERTESPWYPSMRLFRQRSFGDWATVFGDMVAALTPLVRPTA